MVTIERFINRLLLLGDMGRLTPLGMALGGPVGSMIGTALSDDEKEEAITQEIEEHNRIVRDLDTILSQYKQEIQFEVDTLNLPMPKDERNFLIRLLFPMGWMSEFPDSSENRIIYFQRMFRESNIFGKEQKMIYLNRDSLWLEFEVVQHEKTTEKRKVILFEPHYTDKERIGGDIPFEIDKYSLKYAAYSTHKPSEDIQPIKEPSKAIVK